MKTIIAIFALFSLLMPAMSSAQTLIVGGHNYAPFMDKLSKSGVYHDLVAAISAKSGLKYQWKYYPYARLDQLFQLGVIHLEVGSTPIWTKYSPVQGEYTDLFYNLVDVVAFRPNEQFDLNSPKDIAGKKIGIVRGYAFPKFHEAFQSGAAKRFDSTDEAQLMYLLNNGRFDAIFINKQVFMHIQKQNPAYKDLIMGNDIGHFEVGIRVNPDFKHVIPSLNQAIKALTLDGTIQAISERYLLETQE